MTLRNRFAKCHYERSYFGNMFWTHKINPFPANVPILYLLKTPGNQRLVYNGGIMGTLARNGLRQLVCKVNQLTAFYMMETLVIYGLTNFSQILNLILKPVFSFEM